MLQESNVTIRQKFTDCLTILNYVENLIPRVDDESLTEVSDEIKSLRGLWLVSLYGAFERSINMIFTDTISEIEKSNITFNEIKPSLKSIFSHSHIQRVKTCSRESVVKNSILLFRDNDSISEVSLSINPLDSYLQNVDGTSIVFLCDVLSIDGYEMDRSSIGRLGNLRERRNAVAHGRETPAEVGGRFNFDNLITMHEIASNEANRFHLTCKEYCDQKYFYK